MTLNYSLQRSHRSCARMLPTNKIETSTATYPLPPERQMTKLDTRVLFIGLLQSAREKSTRVGTWGRADNDTGQREML